MKNLWIRSISGVLFLGFVLAALLISPWLFGAFQVFALVVMLLEFYRMTMGTHYPISRTFAILAGVAFFLLLFVVSKYPALSQKLVALALIPLLGVMVGSLYTQDKKDFGLFSNLYTGLLYLAVPIALSNLLVFNAAGTFDGRLMLAFFIMIWSSDVGAYSFGMLFGKNGKKLFPSISPKKSWAGFWGGLATTVAAALILQMTPLLPVEWYHALVLGVLMHIAGVFGDLFESQWKRACDVKDSGNIIPGHGGVMDRLDSAIFAMPVGAIYLIAIGLL